MGMFRSWGFEGNCFKDGFGIRRMWKIRGRDKFRVGRDFDNDGRGRYLRMLTWRLVFDFYFLDLLLGRLKVVFKSIIKICK